MAEAIRWGICEGELLQRVGRGRGVNRDAAHPLDVHLLCNVPLPVPIDKAGTFEDFKPTPAQVMEARGVRLINTAAKGAFNVVSAVLPDIYSTPIAAKSAAGRGDALTASEPYKDTLIGIRCRERWSAARAKPVGSRYAVPVEVRAEAPETARALLAGIGLELVGGIKLLPKVEVQPPEGPEAPVAHQFFRSRCQARRATPANEGRLILSNRRGAIQGVVQQTTIF